MDGKRPRPSTGPSSNGGGKFLQGVWMSKCESGRIERLTKWSDGQRDQKLGTLDQQEHNSMVRMNLKQLEIRDELAALKKSKRTPVSGHQTGVQEASSPRQDRRHGKSHDVVSASSSKKLRGREETASSWDSGKMAGRSPGGMRSHPVGTRSPKDVTSPHGSGKGKASSRSAGSTTGSDRHSMRTKTELKENPISTKTVQTPVTTLKSDNEEKQRPVRKVGRVELDVESMKLLNGKQDHLE